MRRRHWSERTSRTHSHILASLSQDGLDRAEQDARSRYEKEPTDALRWLLDEIRNVREQHDERRSA